MFELMPFGYRRVSAYNPFRDFEEMSRSFWDNNNVSAFRTDITEKDGQYILEADLPGFKKEDISVDIDKDCLTITAEHSSDKKEEDKKRNFVKRERYYGSFTRSFDVSGIDVDRIEAEYNNGVLTLNLPKKQENIPVSRRLEIK